jgi:multicomponent Na+:H+ antiporter subunit C
MEFAIGVYIAAGATLFALGIGAVMLPLSPLRRLLAINVATLGTFLLFVSVAARGRVDGFVDPVPHALVLTGIVVAVSMTALALGLLRLHARLEQGGDMDSPDRDDA